MYLKGRGGLGQNDKEAAVWYRRAAEQGFAEAQNNLGWMYREGRGVPRDDAEAVKWMRKAAEQDLAAGQNNLGLMYQQGRGVPHDSVEAAAWFTKAAAQGDQLAKKNLAARKKIDTVMYASAAFLVVLVVGFVSLILILTRLFSEHAAQAGGTSS
jgi:TPR repeat protein